MDWPQKVVFITGASSGIGRALAVELGKKGTTLGLLARRAEVLNEIVGEVESAGGRALALPVDVRDAEVPYLMEFDDAVKKIVKAIEKRKKSYACPWQLATIVRAAMLMPVPMYDRIISRRSYRE